MTDVLDGPTDAGELVIPSVDVAPEDGAVGWRHRHLLDVDDLSIDDIDLVMRTADAMREVLARPIAKVPALRGRNVTILFYEASTRTRVSFEVAAKNLGAALRTLTAAAAIEPDNPVVLANLGLVTSDSGQPAAAIPYLQRALSLDPGLHQARFGLAVAFLKTGKRADASREAAELLRRLPADAPQRAEVERLLAAAR